MVIIEALCLERISWVQQNQSLGPSTPRPIAGAEVGQGGSSSQSMSRFYMKDIHGSQCVAGLEAGLSQRETGHMPFKLVCVDSGQRR